MNSYENLLDDIVKRKELWKYYYTSKDYESYQEIIRHYSLFIEDYLKAGSKILYFDEEVLYSLLKDEYRCKHTISIFFLGLYIYNNNNDLKDNINKFIKQYNMTEKEFVYYWFLICFFHDVYSNLEKNNNVRITYEDLIEFEKVNMDLFQGSNNILPDIIKSSYKNYFRNFRNSNDHGIVAGILYYNDRKKTYYKCKRESNSITDTFSCHGVSWSLEKLHKDHYIIAWIIIAHNVFFVNKDIHDYESIKNYKESNIKELIIEKPVINLKEFPMLFLLSLVDSIDPYKCTEGNELIKFVINNNQFDITNITSDYKKKIKNQEYWLGINVLECQNVIKIRIL